MRVNARRPGFALALAWIFAACAASAADGASAASAAGASPPDVRPVIHLTRCAHGASCGSLSRPFDPLDPRGKTITVYFEWFAHRSPGKARGILVAAGGGPGPPATESRDAYLALFAPFRDSHDVLIMDNRGTGKSSALDCAPLQRAARPTPALIGQCGASLGAAAPLYSTAYAADDLAAILTALQAPPADLYGNSYGTYFAQVFALRHPQMLRSLILDGAYPIGGPDIAWHPSYAPAVRAKFDTACQRSPECARLPGSSMQHIQAALDALRAHPFDARARDFLGQMRAFRADAGMLAVVMFSAAPAFTSVRDLDAAARAFAAGDHVPLLRAMADAVANVDSRDASRRASAFSEGLAAAVMCQDAPQVFDMRLPLAARRAQFEQLIAAREREAPQLYAPFTIAEYRTLPLDYSDLEQCVAWPASDALHPAGHVITSGTRYPAIPVLVVSGELDHITILQEGADVATPFPNARQVVIANSFHVNALPHARSACAAHIARHFIERLEAGDVSCASAIPPLKLTAEFSAHTGQVMPALALAGNAAPPSALRCARAAVLTADDAIARLPPGRFGRVAGLRGGEVMLESKGDRRRAVLFSTRWTEDLPVSGFVEWQVDADGRPVPASRQGRLRMRTSTAAGGACILGDLRVEWSDGPARVSGSIDSTSVEAQVGGP